MNPTDAPRRSKAGRRVLIAALIVAVLWIADEVRHSLLDIDDAIAAVEAGTELSQGLALQRRVVAPLRYWNFRTARRVFQRLTDDGDAIAPLHLGWLYCRAHGVDYDHIAGQQLFAVSAERGYVPAFVTLADAIAGVNAPVNLYCGGSARDYEKVIHWRLLAARHGHVDSLAEAGFMVLLRRDSGLMDETGRNMLREAWEAGSYHAASALPISESPGYRTGLWSRPSGCRGTRPRRSAAMPKP